VKRVIAENTQRVFGSKIQLWKICHGWAEPNFL
jgi:hypothetical protein